MTKLPLTSTPLLLLISGPTSKLTHSKSIEIPNDTLPTHRLWTATSIKKFLKPWKKPHFNTSQFSFTITFLLMNPRPLSYKAKAKPVKLNGIQHNSIEKVTTFSNTPPTIPLRIAFAISKSLNLMLLWCRSSMVTAVSSYRGSAPQIPKITFRNGSGIRLSFTNMKTTNFNWLKMV